MKMIVLVNSTLLWTCLLSFCLVETLSQSDSDRVVVTAGILGDIAGTTASTLGRATRNYTHFLGIPYAHPPTRFQPSSVLEENLSGVEGVEFNATTHGSECPQPVSLGSEDCLFLNIFTPRVSNASEELLPVIVYIHGAAFVSGNSDIYTGARLLNRDLLLVSFNYRLGVFGFLNLETPLAPGNLALYDTVTVLQWVQKYISHFGGDPSRVTLAGQSSGSAMSSHLLLSPLAQGLFHRVISASGSALDVWATAKDPFTAALQVAYYVGCYAPPTTPDKDQILACLLSKTHSELSMAQIIFQIEDRKGGNIGFAAVCPSVQHFLGEGISPPPIVPLTPQTVLESGGQLNVPLMAGATRDDGGFALRLVLEGFIQPNNLTDDSEFMRSGLLPTIISTLGIDDSTHAIADAHRRLYLSPEAANSGNFSQMTPGLMDMLGSIFFKSGAYRTAQLHQSRGVFLYSFEYEGRYTRHPPGGFPGGVAHADDLIYIFQLSGDLNEEELVLSETMVDYWANFATTGDPNDGSSVSADLPLWAPFNTSSPAGESGSEYLLLNNAGVASTKDYPGSWVIANKPPTINNPPTTPTSCTNSAHVVRVTSALPPIILPLPLLLSIKLITI